MTDEVIAVTLKDHENEIKSLKHRMKKQEDKDKNLTELTTSVKTLAVNMEYMAKEQTRTGERLERLEREPAESHKYFKRTIWTSIITTVVGAMVGAVLTLIYNGGI